MAIFCVRRERLAWKLRSICEGNALGVLPCLRAIDMSPLGILAHPRAAYPGYAQQAHQPRVLTRPLKLALFCALQAGGPQPSRIFWLVHVMLSVDLIRAR